MNTKYTVAFRLLFVFALLALTSTWGLVRAMPVAAGITPTPTPTITPTPTATPTATPVPPTEVPPPPTATPTEIPLLPETGSFSPSWSLALGALLLCCAAGATLLWRRQQ